jgi:hypothetical protein
VQLQHRQGNRKTLSGATIINVSGSGEPHPAHPNSNATARNNNNNNNNNNNHHHHNSRRHSSRSGSSNGSRRPDSADAPVVCMDRCVAMGGGGSMSKGVRLCCFDPRDAIASEVSEQPH